MVHFQFLPSGYCGSFVLFFIRILDSSVFSVWNFSQFVSQLKLIFFRWRFIFCTFCLQSWGLQFASANGSHASVIHHVMTRRVYKKLNRSGLDFLVLVLQSSNSFILNAFFNFASVNFFLATWFMFSFCLQGLVVLLSCSPYDDRMFWFFGSKVSNCSPLKLVF